MIERDVPGRNAQHARRVISSELHPFLSPRSSEGHRRESARLAGSTFRGKIRRGSAHVKGVFKKQDRLKLSVQRFRAQDESRQARQQGSGSIFHMIDW
jgi:hypothetical protein